MTLTSTTVVIDRLTFPFTSNYNIPQGEIIQSYRQWVTDYSPKCQIVKTVQIHISDIYRPAIIIQALIDHRSNIDSQFWLPTLRAWVDHWSDHSFRHGLSNNSRISLRNACIKLYIYTTTHIKPITHNIFVSISVFHNKRDHQSLFLCVRLIHFTHSSLPVSSHLNTVH